MRAGSAAGAASSLPSSSTRWTSSPRSSFPATSTPGAHAAAVAAFIELMVADWYTEEDRSRVPGRSLGGGWAKHAGIGPDVRGRLGGGAAGTGAGTRCRGARRRAHPSDSFWRRFKALTIYGYFTSEVGVQEQLKTPFMPGFYDGDAPIAAARESSR